jgi:hypothetical protein
LPNGLIEVWICKGVYKVGYHIKLGIENKRKEDSVVLDAILTRYIELTFEEKSLYQVFVDSLLGGDCVECGDCDKVI